MHRFKLLVTVVLVGAVGACQLTRDLATSPTSAEPTSPAMVSGQTAFPGMASGHSSHQGSTLAESDLDGNVQRQIARLREVTAPFHNFGAAEAAHWGTQVTDCFSDPQQGGMGFHYGNIGLIDSLVDADKPELLLYEPMKNGKLRFVAVEYIVPFNVWTASAPPSLFGLSFHRNEAAGLWILHVWHFQENPRGIFNDWNPRVSCQFAGA
jgi:hypothetical protein